MKAMKAIIFSHENDGSYVMDQDGCFRFVRGYASQPVGTEIELKTQSPVTFMRVASAAACFILVVSISIFAWLWNATSYYIYIDINPSVELRINGVGRIRSASPLNDDGEALLSGLNLRGTAEDAVVSLIEAAKQKNILSATDGVTDVLITVIATGSRSADAQITTIETALEENGMRGYTAVEAGSAELRERAGILGVSPGRLRLAEAMLQGSGQHMSLEELLNIPINELFTAINTVANIDIPLSQGDNTGSGSEEPPNGSDDPAGSETPGGGRIGSDNSNSNIDGGDPQTDDPAQTTGDPQANNPPANNPPANEPPANDPPANDPPVSEPPVSDPPASEPTVSEPPASDPPVINPPINNQPANDPPVITDPPGPAEHGDDCDCEDCVESDPGPVPHGDDCDCEDCAEPDPGPVPHEDDCDCEDCTDVVEPPHEDDCDCEDCVGDDNPDEGEAGEGFGATVFAMVAGSGNERYVDITITDTFGTYEQTFAYVNGTAEAIYIVDGTHINYKIYIGFSGNKVETIFITDFEVVDEYAFGASVTAIVEGTGSDRTITITITDRFDEVHEQTLPYTNGISNRMYVVEGTAGKFTVYAIFQGNEVRAVMIINFEEEEGE